MVIGDLEMYNKMSQVTLLTAFSSRKPEELNFKNTEVLVGKEDQPWFKRAHVRQYLGTPRIITMTTKFAKKDIKSRDFLQAEKKIRIMEPLKKTLKIMIYSYHLLVSSFSL